MLLTDFPEELLDLIVHYATRGSLKNLRLTSKLFERLASPLIWDRIWISSHPLDLEVFKRVTESRFASNIRELVWDDTTFQRPLMNWKNFVHVNEDGHSLRRGAKYSPTRGAFEKWCEVAQGHHYNRTRHLDQEALNEALPRLTNLKRVVLTNRNVEPIPHEDEVPEYGSSPTTRQWKQWPERVPFPPSVCWYDDSHYLDFVGELLDIDYLDDALPELAFQGALENARPFRGLAILLQALDVQRTRTGQPAVEEFVIRPSYEAGMELGPGISYLFFSRFGPQMTQMANLFEGLRVLNLVISNGPHPSLGLGVMLRGNLTLVLLAARQLEDLTLEVDFLPILAMYRDGNEDAGALDANNKYDALKKVSFINGQFQKIPLLRFLRNHRKVLKEVQFYKCNLHYSPDEQAGNTWRDVLHEAKNMKLRYKSFAIEDCTTRSAGVFFNNNTRSPEDFEKFFTGNASIPLDENIEEQNEDRYEYYDRYY